MERDPKGSPAEPTLYSLLQFSRYVGKGVFNPTSHQLFTVGDLSQSYEAEESLSRALPEYLIHTVRKYNKRATFKTLNFRSICYIITKKNMLIPQTLQIILMCPTV